MKMITLEITAASANALLDATSDPVLLRQLAKALAGTPASKPVVAKPKVKPAKVAAKPKAVAKPRVSKGDTTENAVAVLAKMTAGTAYMAETLRGTTKLDKKALSKALKLLVDEKKVVQTGEKRGTRYTLA